ncbi:MAG: glycosyltransferase family 39 protein [Chloroflexi bacterium]|nr:glycosyltransferase family 39 protein [Chloroflexota bacterium]
MKANVKAMRDQLRMLLKPGFIGWLLVISGVVLRLRQYIANRSFWIDEANLALNIINRSFGGLTQPLDYQQGAPIGFLFIEKSTLVVLGNKDYILRLFPLFSGLLALYLMYRIAREYLGTAGLFAVFVFSISWPLIYYSSELKQYSSDAMIALLLVYLSSPCFGDKSRARDFILLGAAGFIAIWTSHPSTFVLAGIGFTLIFDKLIRKAYTPLLWTLGLGLVWVASLGAVYMVSLRYLAANDYLQTYWKDAFMPSPPWENWGWFTKSYLSLLVTISPSLDRWYLALSCSILIVVGIVSLFFRNRIAALLVMLPFFMASIASELQKYPLRGRFLLFLVPFAILLMAEGLGRIYSLIAKWNRGLAITVSGAAILMVFWIPLTGINAKFRTPPLGEDIKPVMAYVQNNRTPNDIVYVYHAARPAFNYYAPFYDLTTGQIIAGKDIIAPRRALQQFMDDINGLKGNNRVWFIFSHVADCGGCRGDMEAFYTQYIDQFGTATVTFKATNADVYLYDLNRFTEVK